MKKLRFVGVRFIVFGLVFALVVGFGVSALWNALVPAIFNLPTITFWQAIGLVILSRIFFGHFGGGRRFSKARLARGWGSLTPEQRARFRQAMGSRCPPNLPEQP
jgi:Ca2+/H+ antiporter, TMEM165/GDT1 family